MNKMLRRTFLAFPTPMSCIRFGLAAAMLCTSACAGPSAPTAPPAHPAVTPTECAAPRPLALSAVEGEVRVLVAGVSVQRPYGMPSAPVPPGVVIDLIVLVENDEIASVDLSQSQVTSLTDDQGEQLYPHFGPSMPGVPTVAPVLYSEDRHMARARLWLPGGLPSAGSRLLDLVGTLVVKVGGEPRVAEAPLPNDPNTHFDLGGAELKLVGLTDQGGVSSLSLETEDHSIEVSELSMQSGGVPLPLGQMASGRRGPTRTLGLRFRTGSAPPVLVRTWRAGTTRVDVPLELRVGAGAVAEP